MHRIKLEKSGITSFVRVRNKDDKHVDFSVTFSEPVMESALRASANKVLGKGYTITNSYMRVRFDFEEVPEDECCPKLKKFLKQLDNEIVKVENWVEKRLFIETGVE